MKKGQYALDANSGIEKKLVIYIINVVSTFQLS